MSLLIFSSIFIIRIADGKQIRIQLLPHSLHLSQQAKVHKSISHSLLNFTLHLYFHTDMQKSRQSMTSLYKWRLRSLEQML